MILDCYVRKLSSINSLYMNNIIKFQLGIGKGFKYNVSTEKIFDCYNMTGEYALDFLVGIDQVELKRLITNCMDFGYVNFKLRITYEIFDLE